MKEKKEIEVFDAELQYPAVKQLVEDPNLLRDIHKILNPNHFNQGWLRQAVGCMVDYYSTYGTVPSYKDLKFLMSSKYPSDDDKDFINETIDKIKKATDISPVIAVENLKKLSKVKYSGAIGKQLVELAQTGYWDEKKVKKIFNDLQKLFDVGSTNNEIARYDEVNISKVLSQGYEDIVPTGIKELDNALDGGLPKKEFGIFSARQGAGKTTFGTVVSHNTSLAGYKTVQLVFEDELESVLRQHMAIELQKNRKSLRALSEERTMNGVEYLKKKDSYTQLNENLIIWHPDGDTTVEDIEQFLINISNRFDFKTEVLIIDYFGCIKHTTNPTKDKTTAEEQAMKKIKRIIAHKYKIAVWVLYQKNRSGASNVSRENYDPLATIQGSYNATLDCSVWIDMYRSSEQKHKNLADFIFVKTRNTGEAEDFNNIIFNNGTLTIDCSNVDREKEDFNLAFNENEQPPHMRLVDLDQE